MHRATEPMLDAANINLLAEYLADPQLKNLATSPAVDCIVICASAVLHGAEVLFRTLETHPSLTKCLVLCGGIGHSTHFLHDAVAQHPRFSRLASSIRGLPEARVLEKILGEFYDVSAITSRGCRILIEDKSTNCGGNAIESRKVLDAAGLAAPTTCVIVQDPTMMLRTRASFEKAYEDLDRPPQFISCPVFVPQVQVSASARLEYSSSLPPGLWDLRRFFELIMGEIPRLRDDEEGYGPNGRGFIPHVDVPAPVEAAWGRLRPTLQVRR